MINLADNLAESFIVSQALERSVWWSVGKRGVGVGVGAHGGMVPGGGQGGQGSGGGGDTPYWRGYLVCPFWGRRVGGGPGV